MLKQDASSEHDRRFNLVRHGPAPVGRIVDQRREVPSGWAGRFGSIDETLLARATRVAACGSLTAPGGDLKIDAITLRHVARGGTRYS